MKTNKLLFAVTTLLNKKRISNDTSVWKDQKFLVLNWNINVIFHGKRQLCLSRNRNFERAIKKIFSFANQSAEVKILWSTSKHDVTSILVEELNWRELDQLRNLCIQELSGMFLLIRIKSQLKPKDWMTTKIYLRWIIQLEKFSKQDYIL